MSHAMPAAAKSSPVQFLKMVSKHQKGLMSLPLGCKKQHSQSRPVTNIKKLTNHQVADLTATSDYQQPDKNILATVGKWKINSIPRGAVLKQTENSMSEMGRLSVESSSMHPRKQKAEEASKRGDKDTQILHQMLQQQLPNYSYVVIYQWGQMQLMVFVGPEISIDVLQVNKAVNTGKIDVANKDGIVAELCINKNLQLSVLSAWRCARRKPNTR
jgi:hypothetical protein